MNVHLLEKSSIVINNIKIIGTTLWTNISDYAFQSMNDRFNVFKTSIDYNTEHFKCFEWLKEELLKNDDMTTIVVTHHLPTNNFNSSKLYSICKFKQRIFNRYYR